MADRPYLVDTDFFVLDGHTGEVVRDAPVDWRSFALALLALLDRIDTGKADDVPELCTQRFGIAEQFGLEVEFGGEASGEVQ